MKRNTKITLGAGCAMVVGMMIPLGLFFYQISHHERWVNDRLETFANYTYDDWKLIHDACADLAKTGESLSVTREKEGWDSLPEDLKQTEAMWIWVEGNRVTLRFSGGHSRFVHIEYYGGNDPAQLELIAEWMYTGVVYPAEDQRPVGEKRLDTEW